MAGLDTRGLASGFAQGFGMVNQYQRGQRADKRADQQMRMQQERMEMQREQFGEKQEEIQRARDMEDLQFTLGKIGSGMDVGEDEVDLLKKYPKFWAALDPDTDASIEQAQSVIDPESPVDGNDPESLAALNQMFGAEINKGGGGNKRVVGMVPGPDGESVMLELEVEGEDGKPYRAPMTKGRGTDADDMVMAVPVERLVEQTQGMRMLRNTFQSPEAQASATKVLNLLRGESPERWEQVQGPSGSILQRNTRTGEMKSVMGRAPQRGGSGRPPSRIQEAEELVGRGVYSNFGEAYEAVRARAGESSQMDTRYIDFLGDELDRVNSQMDGYKITEKQRAKLEQQRDQLRDELDNASRQAFGRPGGGARSGNPAPSARQRDGYPQEGDMVGNPGSAAGAGEPAAASGLRAPSPGHVEDGFEYLGGDPGDPNSWRKR